MSYAYLNWSRYQISFKAINFKFWDQICPKRVFSLENEKSEHYHLQNFSLNWYFWLFGPNLPKIRIFVAENRKSEHHHWALHIWISLGKKFHFKQSVLNFMTKFAPKKVFSLKIEKSEHQWMRHIWISLGTKFQLKFEILWFWNKFAQDRYFQSEPEKVNAFSA